MKSVHFFHLSRQKKYEFSHFVPPKSWAPWFSFAARVMKVFEYLALIKLANIIIRNTTYRFVILSKLEYDVFTDVCSTGCYPRYYHLQNIHSRHHLQIEGPIYQVSGSHFNNNHGCLPLSYSHHSTQQTLRENRHLPH